MSSPISSLAVYGIDPGDDDLCKAYEEVLKWFDAGERVPDRAGVGGEGFSDQTVTFKRADAKLRRQGFAGVTSLEIKCMLPGWQNIGDYWMCAVVSREAKRRYGVLSVDSSLMTLAALAHNPVIERIMDLLQPTYGIGYVLERSRGPSFYACGVGVSVAGVVKSPEEYNASRQSARWGDSAMLQRLYDKGIIRDVYPMSFLNESQLEAKVGQIALRQWIDSNAARGTLTAAPAGLWRWDVAAGNIESIRKPLWDAGIIYDWHKWAT